MNLQLLEMEIKDSLSRYLVTFIKLPSGRKVFDLYSAHEQIVTIYIIINGISGYLTLQKTHSDFKLCTWLQEIFDKHVLPNKPMNIKYRFEYQFMDDIYKLKSLVAYDR